jgi:transcriptional regulator with XRE-family HTH domain
MNVTIKALATHVGIDMGHLSRIERGQKTPSLGTLMGLSRALGTSMAELLGETVADVTRGSRAPPRPFFTACAPGGRPKR